MRIDTVRDWNTFIKHDKVIVTHIGRVADGDGNGGAGNIYLSHKARMCIWIAVDRIYAHSLLK